MPWDSVPPVVLPLSVPFPAKCAKRDCLNFGGHSTFDPGKLELSGDPVPAEQVGNFQGLAGFFSASANGVLVYGGRRLCWEC